MISKRYEIWMQDTDREYYVRQILNKYFNNYSIFKCGGVWKGTKEDALCIVVLAEDSHSYLCEVKYAAAALKEAFRQENVLITESPVQGTLI